jgi:pyridoxamine 5'-phosphate oxidase
MNPIEQFKEWMAEEQNLLRSAQNEGFSVKEDWSTAGCFSTIGLDGFPNARFVSLKEVVADGFIITGELSSRKGLEVAQNNRVALTFWWPLSGKQVRIQGKAHRLQGAIADQYFQERPASARMVSVLCKQGEVVEDFQNLQRRYQELSARLLHGAIRLERPETWGALAIYPIRIELMAFAETRLHHRILYEWFGERWVVSHLEP